tara:strand:+ start:611 stop:796 length:186 start_codon:yes stop_codon:yes gene_type:complete
MGNTISVNVGNSGAVVPMNGTGEDKVGAAAPGINIGNTTAAEEEEEPGCFEKLGCMLCGGD